MNAKQLGMAMALAAGLGMSGTASAITVVGGTEQYNFSGKCTDCSGFVTASLVLYDFYTPGATINSSHFVSFTYGGSNLLAAFTITQGELIFINGAMPVTPGFADLRVSGNVSGPPPYESFISLSDGRWSVGAGPADFGTNGTWSAAPEPTTLALLGLGLAGLGFSRRRAH